MAREREEKAIHEKLVRCRQLAREFISETNGNTNAITTIRSSARMISLTISTHAAVLREDAQRTGVRMMAAGVSDVRRRGWELQQEV